MLRPEPRSLPLRSPCHADNRALAGAGMADHANRRPVPPCAPARVGLLAGRHKLFMCPARKKCGLSSSPSATTSWRFRRSSLLRDAGAVGSRTHFVRSEVILAVSPCEFSQSAIWRVTDCAYDVVKLVDGANFAMLCCVSLDCCWVIVSSGWRKRTDGPVYHCFARSRGAVVWLVEPPSPSTARILEDVRGRAASGFAAPVRCPAL